MAANPVFRAPELKFETEKENAQRTVRAIGRITLGTSATLENTLRDLGFVQSERVGFSV